MKNNKKKTKNYSVKTKNLQKSSKKNQKENEKIKWNTKKNHKNYEKWTYLLFLLYLVRVSFRWVFISGFAFNLRTIKSMFVCINIQQIFIHMQQAIKDET